MSDLSAELRERFRRRFGRAPQAGAFAPGRVEVLGNHTDYNEGFVLSAAIDLGTWFYAASNGTGECRLLAAGIDRECVFPAADPSPSAAEPWSNYTRGVFARLSAAKPGAAAGFDAVCAGTLPLGAGLSSSAALEISSGLALARLLGIEVAPLDLAKIGQAAEHGYVGVKCGLLDQITSLMGREHCLVLTDFRSLEVRTSPLSEAACFVICNTRVKHSLVESEYNERRERCEEAAAYFRSVLPHPVAALRDVSEHELREHAARMPALPARRAAHVIGENRRVLEGDRLLRAHRLAEFGRLMFESHESSRTNFENSCGELDAIVETARALPGAHGARLSGGGFGGSAVVLTDRSHAETVGEAIRAAYATRFGHPCEVLTLRPAAGARLLEGPF